MEGPTAVLDLSEKPAFVKKVEVELIDKDRRLRTKSDILKKICTDLFKVENFHELVMESTLAQKKMEALQLFKHVHPIIDTVKDSPTGYKVTFMVTEGRFKRSIGVEVDEQAGGAKFDFIMPNILGRGERLGLNLFYGTKNTQGQLTFSKPINASPTTLWNSSLYKSSTEYPWSSYRETARGGTTNLSFMNALGEHQLGYEGMWREVKSLTKNTDMSVREEAGHSVKSSLKYSFTRDKRDHKIFPSEGYLLGSTFELAGLGGDAKFIKKDTQLQLNKSFFEHYVMQLTLSGGWSKSLRSDGHMHISDRSYLGGPLTMRGFTINGCGPRNGDCSVGGNTYCQAVAHLYSPLPFRAGKGGISDKFRLHAFGCAGSVLNANYSRLQMAQLGRDLQDSMRLSYGVGIAANFLGIARLELNYCFPFRTHPNDSSNPGWQFGFGLTFS